MLECQCSAELRIDTQCPPENRLEPHRNFPDSSTQQSTSPTVSKSSLSINKTLSKMVTLRHHFYGDDAGNINITMDGYGGVTINGEDVNAFLKRKRESQQVAPDSRRL
jgi:hypothetical protein